MERTLLLDVSYQPVAVISWQRALTLLTLGKIEIIEEFDREIRSRYIVFKMPAVVRLLNIFKRHKKRIKFSRQNVLARDRWKCQYCGQKHDTRNLTYDHVVPRARGGKTCWENIVTSCIDCNGRKADRTPEQAGMKLRSKPIRPDWVPVFSVQISQRSMPDAWRDYLYWTLPLDED